MTRRKALMAVIPRITVPVDPEGPAMSGAGNETLYDLIDIAQQQQAAAQTVLEQLAEERAALAQERDHWANSMDAVRNDVSATVLKAVSDGMAGIADLGYEAINSMSVPLAELMEQTVADAEQAGTALRGVIRWANSRLLTWGLGSLGCLVLFGWVASGMVLWWDTKAIVTAQVVKMQLQAEVAELRANREAWVKAGMAAKLQHCGLTKRLCIPVDETAGPFGEQSDYRAVKGP